MPSPFPGMDPYLEGYMWADVHHELATIECIKKWREQLGANDDATNPRQLAADPGRRD